MKINLRHNITTFLINNFNVIIFVFFVFLSLIFFAPKITLAQYQTCSGSTCALGGSCVATSSSDYQNLSNDCSASNRQTTCSTTTQYGSTCSNCLTPGFCVIGGSCVSDTSLNYTNFQDNCTTLYKSAGCSQNPSTNSTCGSCISPRINCGGVCQTIDSNLGAACNVGGDPNNPGQINQCGGCSSVQKNYVWRQNN